MVLQRKDYYEKLLYSNQNSILNYYEHRLNFLQNDQVFNLFERMLKDKRQKSKEAYDKTINPLIKHINSSNFNKLITMLKKDMGEEFETKTNGKIESIFKNLQLSTEGIKRKKTQINQIKQQAVKVTYNLDERVKSLDNDLQNIVRTFREIESYQKQRINLSQANISSKRLQKYYEKLELLYDNIDVKTREFHTQILGDYAEYASAFAAEKTLDTLEKSFKTGKFNKVLSNSKIEIMGALKEKTDLKIRLKILENEEVFINISNKATQNLEEMKSNKLVNLGGFINEIEKSKKTSIPRYDKYKKDYQVLSNLYLLNPEIQYKNIIFNILERLSRYIAIDSSMEAMGLSSKDPVLFLQIGNKLYTGEEIYNRIIENQLFFYVGQFINKNDFFILRREPKLESLDDELYFRRANPTKGRYQMYVETKLRFNTIQLFLRKTAVKRR